MRALIALMAASVAMSSTWAQEIDEERIADLMATPFAARSNVWTCRPIARYVCGADGCDSAPALVSVNMPSFVRSAISERSNSARAPMM